VVVGFALQSKDCVDSYWLEIVHYIQFEAVELAVFVFEVEIQPNYPEILQLLYRTKKYV